MKKMFLSNALSILVLGTYAQYANTSLSNLSSPTSINHSLTPRITSSFNLGSSQKKWKNLNLSGSLSTDSIKFGSWGLNVSNGIISTSINRYISIEASGDETGVVGRGTVGIKGLGNIGVFGQSNDDASGVWGDGSYSGTGVRGESYAGEGVTGSSTEGTGGSFHSDSYWGLRAETNSGDYAGAFYGDVYTTGSYLPSDETLKKNVQDFSSAMNIINKLHPKYYQYKEESQYASIHLPKGSHYGLMARNVEQVLPGLVKESIHRIENRGQAAYKPSPGGKPLSAEALAARRATNTSLNKSITIKAVNYTELIPVLVKAFQELSADKDKQIADLQSQLNDLKALVLKEGNRLAVTSSKGH